MEKIEILKIQNEDKSLTYRIRPEWEEDCFKILILLENSSSWYADITQQDLVNLAKQRSQNVASYYKNIKQNLIEPESDILFDIKETDGSAKFFIKRKTSGRTVLLFSANLKQQDFRENVFNIIDELFKENTILCKKLEASNEKQTELEEEKQACQDTLSEFVELKTNWEQEMYSNFLIILNEKKKRIKFLTDLIERRNINPDEMQENERHSTVTSPEISPILHKKLETISDSASSSSEYETDKDSIEQDEDDIEAEPVPSTSKHTLEIDDDRPSVLCLPKLPKKGKEKFVPQKIKQNQKLTSTILTEDTQSTQTTQEVPTQEPLSTQERIDRM